MALEAMVLAAPSLEELSLEAPDEQQQSPVDVIINIRKELAEFRRNSSKEALRAEWREACEAALLQAVGSDPFGLDPVIEYLEQRGVIRSSPRPRPRRSSLPKTASRPNRRLAWLSTIRLEIRC
jgi:hypothetical protein